MSDTKIPEGFILYYQDGSFNDTIAPLYYKNTKDGLRFCMPVEKHHCNPMEICHGAVYMALMDIALSSTVCHAIGKFCGTPTISFSLDYLAPSKIGEVLFAETQMLRKTRSMGFSQGVVKNAEGEIKLRASGSFKLPKDIDAALGLSVKDFEELLAKGMEVKTDLDKF